MEYNIKPIFCVDYVVRIFEIQVVPIRKTVNYPSDASSRLADDACWGGHGDSYDNGKYKKKTVRLIKNSLFIKHLKYNEHILDNCKWAKV